MKGVVAYALAMGYSQSLASGVAGSTYDPATSTMTVNFNNGTSYGVVFDDGVTPNDREFLDNVNYDSNNNKLKINGVGVLTENDMEEDDIDFDDMF